MEKIIVEVIVPALGRSFDFEFPAQSTGREAADSSAELLCKLNPSLSFLQPELYDAGNGFPLTGQPSLAAAGIRDGSQLMLI
ncbi:MAG TPA: hypothetical protein PKJ47_09920 [Candidatus Limiplasma sp.]|nr:hypothetical protein [Candidatus Limiplasma sp.]